MTEALFSKWPHMTYHLDSFDVMGYGTNEQPELRVPAPFAESNVVTSLITEGPHEGKHTVALDLDVPAVLVPSSTPGHSHLYIDAEMTWEQYQKLLTALAEAGVVEGGYVGASIARGHTSLRMPWIHKPLPSDNLNLSPWAAPDPEPPF